MATSDAEYREIRLRDGRRLAFLEWGVPGGRPVVHCHGAPSSRVEARFLFDAATTAELGVRIIVPDRPGMGRSDFQPGRRILDWPRDVEELARALGLDRFAVLGSSGGSPYAAACAARIPERVRVLGLLGGMAPCDAPGLMTALSGPLRTMLRLARFAPAVLRGLFRLNLAAMHRVGDRGGDRMAARFPEPDRSLLKRPDVRKSFMACMEESCRQGTRGPVADFALIGGAWGFDLAAISVPARLWHGERDLNVPVAHGRYLAGAIANCRATFYPDEAHLSLPLSHHREILGELAAVAD